jgi:signal transduction histidine kinase
VSNDLRPQRASDLWNNRLWVLSAALGAASIVSMAAIVHDTSRQRAAVRSIVRSMAEAVIALAGNRVEMLALETFAPAVPWTAARPVSNDSAFATLVQVRQNAVRCRCRDTLGANEFFRYDVDTRTIARLPAAGMHVASGSPSSAALERVALHDATSARGHRERAVHLSVARDLGDQAVVSVVQYDSAGAPLAVYGALTRAGDFTRVLFHDASARASLIDSVSRPASLRNIEFHVAGADSTTVSETSDDAGDSPMTIRPGSPFDGFVVTAGLAGHKIPVQIAVGGREMMHLTMLLVATILVIGFAIGSSRRELLLARARSDFIAGVSHDLRMPLAQILIAGETLTLERERDRADRRELSHAIVREARRLVSIVDNVLLFSRSGTERPKPMLQPILVDDLFEDVVQAVGLAVDDAGQSIVVRAPSSLAVLADRHLLRQALVNLVDNALKYGMRGQRIELGAERLAGSVVRISVDDQGPGVPIDERKRVFEPYERLFRDRTSERTGSGLGLAVVREIATALNGRAWLDDAPGGGTRAVIELASAEQADAPALSPAMT